MLPLDFCILPLFFAFIKKHTKHARERRVGLEVQTGVMMTMILEGYNVNRLLQMVPQLITFYLRRDRPLKPNKFFALIPLLIGVNSHFSNRIRTADHKVLRKLYQNLKSCIIGWGVMGGLAVDDIDLFIFNNIFNSLTLFLFII